MTAEQKALIERATELDKNATPGPWRATVRENTNAAFIASARNLVPALAAELKWSAEENARLRHIICATAREPGSLISTESSVEFMSGVQEEARLACDQLAKYEAASRG